MKRYSFEVHQELITPVEVMADSAQDAHERVIHQGEHVTAFDTQYGDMRLVLRSVDDE
jgi:hypothetical protein